MKIVHISDTHGKHEAITIPPCDLLVHTGDIGGRTTIHELNLFLNWFKAQPAECKVFIAGNHDIDLDEKYIENIPDGWTKSLHEHHVTECKLLLTKYPEIVYLENSFYIYKGWKIWGSPISPSFHRNYWAFNADRGEEIKRYWNRIPRDTNILLTHTPPYNIFDDVREYKSENEMDAHVGCKDLSSAITHRLSKLQLHCFGHIHDNYGIMQAPVSNTRRVLFSNGAVLNNRYNVLIYEPPIINLNEPSRKLA